MCATHTQRVYKCLEGREKRKQMSHGHVGSAGEGCPGTARSPCDFSPSLKLRQKTLGGKTNSSLDAGQTQLWAQEYPSRRLLSLGGTGTPPSLLLRWEQTSSLPFVSSGPA